MIAATASSARFRAAPLEIPASRARRANAPTQSSIDFRDKQPPVLVICGKNDPIFTVAGAEAFLKDAPKAELHLLDTGHFALEEEGAIIAKLMRAFLAKKVR